jgi:hypothetical protein
LIEIELFEVERDAEDFDSLPDKSFWVTKEIKRLNDAGFIRPTVKQMRLFLQEQGFTYKTERRESRTTRHGREIVLVKVVMTFENDAEGLYFKMWRS